MAVYHALDIDLILRRSVVYGVLWLAIAATYAGVAALLGVAASQRISVQVAIAGDDRGRDGVPARPGPTGATGGPAGLRREARGLPADASGRVGPGELVTPDRGGGLARGHDPYRDARDLGPASSWRLVRASRHASSPRTGSRSASTVRAGVVGAPRRRRPPRVRPPGRGRLPRLRPRAARHARRGRRPWRSPTRSSPVDLADSRARIVTAETAERRRIERDIHDGVQQQIVALMARLSVARSQLDHGDRPGCRRRSTRCSTACAAPWPTFATSPAASTRRC